MFLRMKNQLIPFVHPIDSDACSTVDSITRVDCGFYGINSTSCIQKGCCWDDSVENVPYCFNKPNTAAPDYGGQGFFIRTNMLRMRMEIETGMGIGDWAEDADGDGDQGGI